MRAEGLNRVKVDIVGGQETWDKVINVSGLESLVLIREEREGLAF